jgi:hypothetical protein
VPAPGANTPIIAVSIPLSILRSIIGLGFLHQTINIMTLGGLALAVSVLVDDATVTIENIERYLEDGLELHEAILEGAGQIAVPAPVSTLCCRRKERIPFTLHDSSSRSWVQRRCHGLRRRALESAKKKRRGLPPIRRSQRLLVSAFFRDANGREVIGVNDARGAGRPEVRVAPRDYGAGGLCGVPPALGLRSEHPTDFRNACERGLQVPLVIGESNLSGKTAHCLLLNYPIAEAEQVPMPNVTQQPGPRLLLGERPAAYVPGYGGVGPHGGARDEIVQAMAPEFEPRGLDDRDLHGGME